MLVEQKLDKKKIGKNIATLFFAMKKVVKAIVFVTLNV